MDINLDYSDDENPITLKSDFILSLCDLIIGGKEGLSPIERTIIDRCTRLVYRDYLQDPCPEKMPVLGDLYDLLLKQAEPEAQNIATALEIYVNGSLNVFFIHAGDGQVFQRRGRKFHIQDAPLIRHFFLGFLAGLRVNGGFRPVADFRFLAER